MKRSAPLRRTPLARGTSQLARTGGLKRGGKLKTKRAKPRRSSRVRDPKHLAWVRTLPCASCGRRAPSEAHHDTQGRGYGQKADDTRTIPMCGPMGCHDEAQQYRGRFKGWDKHQMRAWFEEKLRTVMALKEEHVKLTELPKEDVDLILGLIEDKAELLRATLPRTEGTLAKGIVEAGITRCDELAERIRGAA